MKDFNPIRSVDGVSVKAPSGYKWLEQDLSASDAGRTEDGVMHKRRVGQAVGLELTWQNVTIEEGAQILKAFDPEYITLTYLNAKAGTWLTDIFYVGDRSAPLYNAATGRWKSISFKVIGRESHRVTGDEYWLKEDE